MQPMYRWSGQYYGFVDNGYLFDSISNYCGWVESDGTIWRSDGRFLGDLVGGEYNLLQQSAVRSNRSRRARPATPAILARPDDRTARAQRPGYVDGLENCRSRDLVATPPQNRPSYSWSSDRNFRSTSANMLLCSVRARTLLAESRNPVLR